LNFSNIPNVTFKSAKLGAKKVSVVRCRGGNDKFRALRLETGNFAWGSNAITRKCRILDVVYNSSNNELVRTKTLVKNCIVQIDATPFRQWYESHTGIVLSKKEADVAAAASKTTKVSDHAERNHKKNIADIQLENQIKEQIMGGRLYACISSRPGQCARADGYILEGKELEFYSKKITHKKK